MHPEPLLFQQWPSFQGAIPHTPLCEGPTPVERLKPSAFEAKPHLPGIWVKRDDQTSTLYGGNKVRKLEFILARASSQHHTSLWTLGAAGSNHALATALFGQKLGLNVHIRNVPQPPGPHVAQNLLALLGAGAHIRASSSMASLPKGIAKDKLLLSPEKTTFITLGGSSPLGNLGYLNAALELQEQIDAGQCPEPTRIYVPLGSGGTFAGLWLGARLLGWNTEVIGVRVGEYIGCNEATAALMIWRTLRLLHTYIPKSRDIQVRPSDMKIRHGFLGSTYGATTWWGKQAHKTLNEAKIHGDPTYTDKTAAALFHDLEGPKAPRGPVLLWHTYSSANISPWIQKGKPFTRLPRQLWHYFPQENLS